MSNEKYSEIGSRLKYVRTIKLGFTQEAFAEQLGISIEFYRIVESGRSLPNVSMLHLLYRIYPDIDYILTGEPSGESAFAEVFSGISDIKKENICNLLVYKMRELQMISGNHKNVQIKNTVNVKAAEQQPDELFPQNACQLEYVTMFHEIPDVRVTPYDRIREILHYSHGVQEGYGLSKKKISNEMIARDINKSNRTISRLLNGKAVIRTDMVLAVCEKYNYAPSYVLFGNINNHSLADQYYEQLSEKDKAQVMEFADLLCKYM